MEIQQSLRYKKYIQAIGWHVITLDNTNIFLRHFPLYGGLAKLQRSTKLPNITNLILILKHHHVRTIAVEPDSSIKQQAFSHWCTKLGKHVRLNRNPFLPTKTLLINLQPSEEEIFNNFSEAKRRAVRRSLKHNVVVKESTNIKDLIGVKNKASGLFGFITTYGIPNLWNIFSPKHAAILLAYQKHKIIGGILLLFYDNIAYYWIAGATKQGKKLFAPTLLVWQALKLAKKQGAKQFDFVGAWDERMPNKFNEWKGFTKFKEGFGGTPLYYPLIPQNK